MPSSTSYPPLDNRYRVETPEGIDLVLQPAGLVPRALAFAIDLAIRGALFATLLFAFSLLGLFGLGLAAILLFLVQWWYMVLFEVLNQGRTPGKQWLGLQVLHDDGTPVGWASSLIRNLLRVVDLLPFAYFLGALSCLLHPGFKRLGDLAAGTLVVYRFRPASPGTLPLEGPAQAAPEGLAEVERRALIAFAERHDSLSPARRSELASLLAEPIGAAPAQAEQTLLAIARGLLRSG
ncbi:RDD family protein [Stutzerimonas tarimensis]|uniref:RDD family protein n=1 Tax=Stutzerimonas tarimensis TaxID=1507735 RepID=A0ABV7SZN6_9GAMM